MDNTPVYIFSSLSQSDKTRLSTDVFNKARKGDQGAFGEIYNQFFKKIFRFIFFRVSHKEIAEDLAEEVFLKVYVKIASVRDEQAFEGWLYQIARNAIIDYYREKKTLVNLDDVENTLEYESNFIDVLNLDQDQKLLIKLLNKLPADQKTVLKLKFLEELENEVISQMLNKSEGAIRVIQHRAIIKLQELFKNHQQSNKNE